MADDTGLGEFLTRMLEKYNCKILSFPFYESLDTSGAVAQLDTATPTLVRQSYAMGLTKSILVPKDQGRVFLVGIAGSESAVSDLPGYFEQSGMVRKIRFKQANVRAISKPWFIDMLDHPLELTPGETLKVFANSSGAGADEHAVVVYLYCDGMLPPALARKGAHLDMVGPLGILAGTRVANTWGPLTAKVIAGFQDSELALPQGKSDLYALKSMGDHPGLATSAMLGINVPPISKQNALWQFFIPTSYASDYPVNVDFPGDGILMTGENPITFGAIGSATTSDEYNFKIAVFP